MKTKITKELLIQNGWVESKDQIGIFMIKDIPNENPINDDPEDTDIKLILHGMYNSQTFAVLFPDGGMLNFIANSIEELTDFEHRLTFYDCPY